MNSRVKGCEDCRQNLSMTMPTNPCGGQNTTFERHKVGSAKDTLRIAREAVCQARCTPNRRVGSTECSLLPTRHANQGKCWISKVLICRNKDHAVNFEITPENQWPERPWLKNNRWGGIEYTSMVEIRTGPLHRRARMDVARYLVARARPTDPEAQLGQIETFTRGEPGCSRARAVLAPGPRLRRARSPGLRARPGDWPRPSAAPGPQLR